MKIKTRFRMLLVAGGYEIAYTQDGKHWWYIYRVHRDGTYDFCCDYSHAIKYRNLQTAERHFEAVKNQVRKESRA